MIEGFQKKVLAFKDVTTILQDKEAFKYTIDTLVEELKDKKKVDVIVGPEARVVFCLVQKSLNGLGIRKAGFENSLEKGKLPSNTY